MPKLTPARLAVLRDAAEAPGTVYRSESGSDLYASYDRNRGRQRVSQIAEWLCNAGLLEIGPQERFIRPWLVTDAGREVLAQAEDKA